MVRSVSRTHQRNRDCGPTTPRQPKCKQTRVCVAQCVCARVSSDCAGPRSDTRVLTSRQDIQLRGIPMPRSSSITMTGSASCASAQGARRRGWRKQLVLPSIVLSASCCRILPIHLLPKKKREHSISRSDVVEVGDRITRRSVDGAGRGRSVDPGKQRSAFVLSAALRVPRGKTSPQLVFSSVSSSCAPLQFGQGRQQGPLGGGGRVGAWCCACFPSARLTSLCDRRGKVLRPNNIPKIPACCDCPVCHYAFQFLCACGSLMYRTPGAPCDRARNVACMPSS